MIKRVDKFEEKTASSIEWESIELECEQRVNVYTIKSVHDLTQFIGFGKYINNDNYNVLLRGQPELYDGQLKPSFYRNKQKVNHILPKYNERMNSLKKDVKDFRQYERIILEPLLQHYGVKTPFIDLVDNVWVSLWFALHQAECKVINAHEHIYYHENRNEFSYILLIATDAIKLEEGEKGIYEGEKTRLIDLRKVSPSYFLRPHAQHAYMLKKKEETIMDYSDLIVGIAKIPTSLGLEWLGKNAFLTVSNLFPAAYFDSGYELLLRKYPEERNKVKDYGSIQIVTE